MIAAGAVAVFLVVAVTVGWSGNEVCRRCGWELHYREWRLGLDGPVIRRVSRNETETPVSVVLTPLVGGERCSHEWCFAAGGNYTVFFFSKSCAIGPGRHLWRAVQSTNVAAFLEELGRSTDSSSLWRWRDRLLDPKQSQDAVIAVAISEDNRDETLIWAAAAETEWSSSHPPE